MHTALHKFNCHQDTCTDELFFWQLVGKKRLLAEAAVQEAAWEVEQERIIAEKLATLSKGNVAVVEVRLKQWLPAPPAELQAELTPSCRTQLEHIGNVVHRADEKLEASVAHLRDAAAQKGSLIVGALMMFPTGKGNP